MKLNEAIKILNDAGLIVEHELTGMDKDIRDLLISYGFKKKPRNVFGLFKKVKNGEISVMWGMGRCDLQYTFWNPGERNDCTFTNGFTVKYDEPNALDKIAKQIEHYIEESEY